MPEILNVYVRCPTGYGPKAQPRPRARAIRQAGKWIATVYDQLEEYVPHSKPRIRKPWDAARWKAAIQEQVRQARIIRGPVTGKTTYREPVEGPVLCDMTFYFPRTQEMLGDTFRWGRDDFPYVGKPDVDNLQKLVLDAITQAGWYEIRGVLIKEPLVWLDDAQVCDAQVQKRYCGERGQPGVKIIVESLVDPVESLFEQAEGVGKE